MKEILHSSMSKGTEQVVERPAESALRVHAVSVKRFAETLAWFEPVPVKKYPGFSYSMYFHGDAAHILIHHVDFAEPIVRAFVSWGDRRFAEDAYHKLFNAYLNYIERDPEGIEFTASNAPTIPDAPAFLMQLDTPNFHSIDLHPEELEWIPVLLRILAFNAIDLGDFHRMFVQNCGDPNREYSDPKD